MIKLNKEEYDYLKFIEHEYTNLFDDVEELINNTDDLKYHDMLKLDYEQLDNIISNLFTIPKSGEAWFEKTSNMYKLSLVKSNNAPVIPIIDNVDKLGFNIKDNNILN